LVMGRGSSSKHLHLGESRVSEKIVSVMYKCAVFDINQHITTKFSSQVSIYTHQKCRLGPVEVQTSD